MKRSLLIYPIIIAFFGCLIWLVMDAGKKLEPKSNKATPASQLVVKTAEKLKPEVSQAKEMVWDQIYENLRSPLALLLLQITVILLVSKIFGNLFGKIGQPAVVGEMVAGIFLGPSMLGLLLPSFTEFLFPKSSLNNLQFLSQIGLAFFMFIIGMELNIEKLKNKAHNAMVISHASIVFPYFLGVAVSYFLYESFAPANVSFTAFALFMGIAVSITAFPVLARILQERKLTRTTLGTLVISCAAFDDVTAWCILATVIAIAKAGTLTSALFTIALTVIFVAVMLYLVSPLLKKLSRKYSHQTQLNKPLVVLVFFVLLLSAFATETIGIHALFGAFLAGVIIPREANIKEMLTEKIEDVSTIVLLPLFFAFTGLRTQIALLNDGGMWAACGLIVFVAVLGKFGGSAVSARLTGQSWKDALSIGALMNTRGLMELIVLNIGYDLGILSPALFAIMVLMALSTTFMTGPLLDLIAFVARRKTVPAERKHQVA